MSEQQIGEQPMILETAATVASKASQTIMDKWGPLGALVIVFICALAVLVWWQTACATRDNERLYRLLEQQTLTQNTTNEKYSETLEELKDLKTQVPRDHAQQITMLQDNSIKLAALQIAYERDRQDLTGALNRLADTIQQLLKNEASPN